MQKNNDFIIRKSKEEDFDRIMEIYEYAREFMARTGNPNQWGPNRWPPEEVVRQETASGHGYVCEHWGKVVGAFAYYYGKEIEPSYRVIEDGGWRKDSAYGVIHRLAGDGSVKGIARACLDWAYEESGHLRVDTHGDNKVMQGILGRLGFTHCGTIYVEQDEDPRLAYDKFK